MSTSALTKHLQHERMHNALECAHTVVSIAITH